MAYNKAILKQQIIESIKKNRLIFIEDICAMCGISVDTYYRHFPKNSEDSEELSRLLSENKITLKVALRKKWFESDNATTQMALYKLCSTSEEHRKLQQNYTEMTGQDGAPLIPPIIVRDQKTSDIVKGLLNDE